MSGPRETRPRLGFRPTSPQQAAGIRSEPPPSLPCASGTIPEAPAAAEAPAGAPGGRGAPTRGAPPAAEPPDEPPGVRVGSHGLRVGPVWRGSVVGRIPNSGRFV